MDSVGSPPALAEAADVLSVQLRAHLKRLAKLIRPRSALMERSFRRRMRRLGFDAKQAKALAAITPFAASGLLAGRRPPEAFFEQVEYNGRRLAKLGLSPAQVLEALGTCDEILRPVLDPLAKPIRADLEWVLQQLFFCVVITLNNAFYQVREAETQTYQELFHAELESAGLEELLPKMLSILCRFSRARAGALFLREEAAREWSRKACVGRGTGPDREIRIPDSRALLAKLSRARCSTARVQTQRLALDPRWAALCSSCWSIPLASGGRVAGVMQFGFPGSYEWLPREIAVLTAAAERCLAATDKARLLEQLAARESQVRRLAGHMMEVEERERKRIRSELHDEAGQSLLSLRLQLELLERATPEASVELKAGLADARRLVERTVTEIRRLISDLSPAVLEQLGLAAAVRQLAGRMRRLGGIAVKLHLGHLGRLPQAVERVAYRITQECVNNILRHASATAVNLRVETADGRLRLSVEDNGAGFHVEDALRKRDSFGLAGVRERVALFGGECQIESRPGHGTKVSIEVPVPVGERP